MQVRLVVAGATQRLKIGMNAVVLGFRDPVNFARQCASLERIARYNAVGIDKFVAIPLVRNQAEWMEQTRLLDREVIQGVKD